MRFWDASALVPLVVAETSSTWARSLFEADAEVIVWWATPVECVSAIARLEREGELTPTRASFATRDLDEIAANWTEISPGEAIRSRARRLLRVHALRTADALQLAAALFAAEGHPATLPLVTLDERLANAAEKEEFPVMRFSQTPARGT